MRNDFTVIVMKRQTEQKRKEDVNIQLPMLFFLLVEAFNTYAQKIFLKENGVSEYFSVRGCILVI